MVIVHCFKFGFIGLRPKFGIRNAEFGIKGRGGNSTPIILVNIVDRKGFFENAEVRLQLSLSSPRNSEFRIPNSELAAELRSAINCNL